MTNEIEALFQEIAQAVVSEMKMEFRELWIHAGVTEGCTSERYICKTPDGTLHDLEIDEASDLIYDLWEASRKRGDNWDEMTFHFTTGGEFEINFEYDAPKDFLFDLERDQKWIQKHFGDAKIISRPPPSDPRS